MLEELLNFAQRAPFLPARIQRAAELAACAEIRASEANPRLATSDNCKLTKQALTKPVPDAKKG